VIGAQVSGVDLCAPLDDAAFEDIQSALAAHGVLFFRDQGLSGDQLLDLGRRFGELFIQPVFADQFQELLILTNDEKRPPMLNTFHQDMTGLECPPGEHLLHALVMPDGGGDTIWSCNYSAYEALSGKMQAFLPGLTATHSILYAYARAFDRMPNGEAKRKMVRENHPAVPFSRQNPSSDRPKRFVCESLFHRMHR